MPLLSSAWVEAPLVTTLKCWFARAFSRPCAQCRSCGLSSASVMSVGVDPKWHHLLRLCCANPTARAISDMAVGLNPESNPGLSDRRRQANDVRNRTRSRRGIEPRPRESEGRKFSDALEPGLNPGRANRRFFPRGFEPATSAFKASAKPTTLRELCIRAGYPFQIYLKGAASVASYEKF